MNFSITPERPTSVCWFVIFLLITYSHKMAVAAPDITTKYIRSGSTVREGHNSWCCSSSSSISPLQWTPVNFQLPLPENFSQKPQKAALPMSIKSELLKKKIHIPKEQPQPIIEGELAYKYLSSLVLLRDNFNTDDLRIFPMISLHY